MQRSSSGTVAATTGELHHGKLADKNRLLGGQAIDDGGVVIKDLISERFGAPGSGKFGHSYQIFDSIGNALKGRTESLTLDFVVGIFGSLVTLLEERASQRVVLRTEFLKTMAEELGEFDRRDVAAAESGA